MRDRSMTRWRLAVQEMINPPEGDDVFAAPGLPACAAALAFRR
jgi:hypothetical protein